jgi:hypothetical protein
MKLWAAYKRLNNDYQARLFSVLASHVAEWRGLDIGLIASCEDAASLTECGFVFSDLIKARIAGNTGAEIKLFAIRNYLPPGDALIDSDVFLTAPLQLSCNEGWALNHEPLRSYRNYNASESRIVRRCWPQGRRTINAGLLYLPHNHFQDYASQALELARQIRCIGHTYKQAFFVRYCQENSIVLNVVYPHEVHAQKEVEQMYQMSGIRHPFCYKSSLLEQQRAIDLAMQWGNPAKVRSLLRRYWPAWSVMAERPLFAPL